MIFIDSGASCLTDQVRYGVHAIFIFWYLKSWSIACVLYVHTSDAQMTTCRDTEYYRHWANYIDHSAGWIFLVS